MSEKTKDDAWSRAGRIVANLLVGALMGTAFAIAIWGLFLAGNEPEAEVSSTTISTELAAQNAVFCEGWVEGVAYSNVLAAELGLAAGAEPACEEPPEVFDPVPSEAELWCAGHTLGYMTVAAILLPSEETPSQEWVESAMQSCEATVYPSPIRFGGGLPPQKQ